MTLLAVYFIFILDYRNDSRQKANSSSFLESKMGHKAMEKSHNINNVFDPRTANECAVQWWFKKFCKGDESLEGERSGWPSKVDTNDSWELSSKLILLQLHEKLPKNSVSTNSVVIWHLKQIGKVKKLDKWVPHELTKSCHFAVLSSLTLWNTSEPFLSWSDDQLSGCTREKLQSTSQSQTCTKKRSWSLFGGLLPIWSTRAFWILAKPLHLRSMLSKSMRSPENCNTCKPALVNRKARPHISQPMLQKLNELGYKVLPHPPYSPDLLTTDYHFFKHLNNFLQGKHFHNQQDAENAYKNLSDAQFFYARTINKLISHY